MQQLGGEIGDGLLTPSITTPAFVRYTRGNVAAGAAKAGRDPAAVDVGCTIVASIDATDRDRGRDGAREIAGMYLANKFQNIKGSADTLLDLAEISMEELAAGRRGDGARRPPRGEGAGHRLAARPLQADRRHAGRLHRRDRGVPRGRLLARDARALGRRPARADPSVRRAGPAPRSRMTEVAINEERLVEWASRAIGTPSFTGSEQAMAELMAETFAGMGLQVQWQQVEDGRANVLGTWPGAGGGSSLMFNGHMDTSYSGREPWLAGVRGFQPSAFVQGRAALRARHLEHEGRARLLRRGGARAPGRRGAARRATCSSPPSAARSRRRSGATRRAPSTAATRPGSRYLVSHGGVADMCILGEPTESKVVLGHFGSLWLRISTRGNFIHTAFSEGKRDQNSILRMREVLDAVLEWIPTWEADPENAYRGATAIVNVGAIPGGFGWRVSRTPHRTDLFLDVRVPPTKSMSTARTQVLDMVRGLAERFPDYGVEGEVYVTAPGAEIEEAHPLIGGDRRLARRGVRRRARAGRDALVLGRLGAHARRHRRRSTTARRPACSTRPTARTSTSTGS